MDATDAEPVLRLLVVRVNNSLRATLQLPSNGSDVTGAETALSLRPLHVSAGEARWAGQGRAGQGRAEQGRMGFGGRWMGGTVLDGAGEKEMCGGKDTIWRDGRCVCVCVRVCMCACS